MVAEILLWSPGSVTRGKRKGLGVEKGDSGIWLMVLPWLLKEGQTPLQLPSAEVFTQKPILLFLLSCKLLFFGQCHHERTAETDESSPVPFVLFMAPSHQTAPAPSLLLLLAGAIEKQGLKPLVLLLSWPHFSPPPFDFPAFLAVFFICRPRFCSFSQHSSSLPGDSAECAGERGVPAAHRGNRNRAGALD